MILLIVSTLCVVAGYGLLLTAPPEDYQRAVGSALAGIALSVVGGGMLAAYLFRRILGR